jgi:hypothetical protein
MPADLHKTAAPPIVELPHAGQQECPIPTQLLLRQRSQRQGLAER